MKVQDHIQDASPSFTQIIEKLKSKKYSWLQEAAVLLHWWSYLQMPLFS